MKQIKMDDDKPYLGRALIAGGIGNMVEWYIFLAYSYLAIVIAAEFFPNDVQAKGLIFTFLLFAVGFLSRPLGGIIFGFLGDRVGRQKTLVITQLLMAIPTLLICLLPTYRQIGSSAAILLGICRFFQGMFIAGEYTTSLCYLVEVAPKNRRGFFTSIIPASTALGILLSSLSTFVFIKLIPQADLYRWGWRLIFFVGFVFCLVAVWIRLSLPETQIFLAIKKDKTKRQSIAWLKTQLTQAHYIKNILITVLLTILYAYFYQYAYIWNPIFLVAHFKLAYPMSLLLNGVAMLVFVICVVSSGWLVDQVGRQTILLISLSALTLIILLFAYQRLMYFSLEKQAIFLCGISIFFGGFVAATSALIADIFPPSVRSKTLSMCYNIPFAIVGGFTPVLLSALDALSDFSMIYVITLIACGIGFVASYYAPRA